MRERGRFGGQDLLGLVDLGAVQRLQPRDLIQRQVGEQPQEAADIGVFGVAPELPVIVRAQLVRRSATRRPAAVLPILAPEAVVISGVVSPNTRLRVGAPHQVDAGDDVAPLVGAAHLQVHAMAAVQLAEIVALQDRCS